MVIIITQHLQLVLEMQLLKQMQQVTLTEQVFQLLLMKMVVVLLVIWVTLQALQVKQKLFQQWRGVVGHLMVGKSQQTHQEELQHFQVKL